MPALHIIPDPGRLEECLALARAYKAAFEYNDFYDPALLDDPAALARRVEQYLALPRDRSRDTMHGAFLDVTVHSSDPQIRRVSEARVRASMEIARALGLRGVVFHTGLIPNFRSGYYLEGWRRCNRDFFGALAADFPEIDILMENMFDESFEPLAALAEDLRAAPNFGVCLDYAHARVFGRAPAAWAAALGPYIRHLHINDNDGLEDLHDAVGEGCIDWAEFDRAIRALPQQPSVLIETKDLDKLRRSLAYMERHGIYPFPGRGSEEASLC